jgi:dihydroflavonol-4-reductase
MPGHPPRREVFGDVTDLDSLVRAMPGGVDAVFNLAGDASARARNDARKQRVHVEGTQDVVAAALRRLAKRLVQTSTAGAIGEHGERIDEETPSAASSSRVPTFRTKWMVAEGLLAAGAGSLAS